MHLPYISFKALMPDIALQDLLHLILGFAIHLPQDLGHLTLGFVILSSGLILFDSSICHNVTFPLRNCNIKPCRIDIHFFFTQAVYEGLPSSFFVAFFQLLPLNLSAHFWCFASSFLVLLELSFQVHVAWTSRGRERVWVALREYSTIPRE